METASAAAWPVRWRESHEDFELRASTEDSNRGNCVLLKSYRPDIGAVLPVCRSFCREHGRPVQFAIWRRMAVVDDVLAAMGFASVNSSLFMLRRARPTAQPHVNGTLQVLAFELPAERWLEGWEICAGLPDPVERHFDIVRSIRHPARYVLIVTGTGEPVAVGSCSCHGRYRAFTNLATRGDHRGRGLASTVMAALAADSLLAGVAADILQVDSDNRAVHLYRRLGFEHEWSYHYRRDVS